MQEYLFNQNLIIIMSALATALCFLFIKNAFKKGKDVKYRRTIILICASLGLLVLEIFLADHAFSLANIPNASYVLIFFCDALIIFTLFQSKYNRVNFLYGVLSFVSVFILLALVINNYYQYYPTLGSIFTKRYLKQNSISTITVTRERRLYNIENIERNLFSGGRTTGTVTAVNIPGIRSHLQARNAYVYLPPAYNDKSISNVKFPVIVLLVGTPGDPSSWLQGGLLISTMNNFAAHHEGITPIIVIADHTGSFSNDTECVNSSHGNAETYLIDDVPSYIKQHYRVSSNPVNWGIAGFSEGGMCAAMLTLEHQEVYRHFLDMSGDPYPFLDNRKETLPVLFNGSTAELKEHNIDWLIDNKKIDSYLTAQFAIGADDNKNLISEMQQTYHEVNKRGIPTSFELIEHQGHSFSTWSRAFNDALPKMSYYLGATECEATCTQ